jgi:hypothetical protein
MANSFGLDTLRQAILSQKIRESHGPSTRRSSNAAPSVSSGASDLNSADKGLTCATHSLLHRLRIASRQSTSPECVGRPESRRAGTTMLSLKQVAIAGLGRSGLPWLGLS